MVRNLHHQNTGDEGVTADCENVQRKACPFEDNLQSDALFPGGSRWKEALFPDFRSEKKTPDRRLRGEKLNYKMVAMNDF